MSNEPLTKFMLHAQKAEDAYRKLIQENGDRRRENKMLKDLLVKILYSDGHGEHVVFDFSAHIWLTSEEKAFLESLEP